ncbi:hypothetical protein D3C77_488730 [compost metagenome]
MRRAFAASDIAWLAPLPIAHALATEQASGGPGLIGPTPLDPRQARAIGTEGGGGVEVCTLGQHLALLCTDGYQAVFDLIGPMGFFHRQYLALGPAQIAVTALALGEWLGYITRQVLGVQLLVGFVDEHQAFIAQAKAAATVFVDPAAHAEAIWRQAMGLAVAPVPDPAGAIAGTELIPEQTLRTDA